MVKKIVISFIALVVLIIGSFVAFVSLTMRPIDNTRLDDNVYVIKDGYVNFFLIQGNSGYIAVDSGMSRESALEGLEELGIDPSEVHSILLTHSDADHSGGIDAFPEADLYIPELEIPLIEGKDFRKLFGREVTGVSPISQMEYTTLSAESRIEIDGLTILSVSVPGHSNGSTAFIINDQFAFIGDMALVSRGKLSPLPSFLNNDSPLAKKTANQFQERFSHLKFIATGHDGILYLDRSEP